MIAPHICLRLEHLVSSAKKLPPSWKIRRLGCFFIESPTCPFVCMIVRLLQFGFQLFLCFQVCALPLLKWGFDTFCCKTNLYFKASLFSHKCFSTCEKFSGYGKIYRQHNDTVIFWKLFLLLYWTWLLIEPNPWM